jgi:hypothetical protein
LVKKLAHALQPHLASTKNDWLPWLNDGNRCWRCWFLRIIA